MVFIGKIYLANIEEYAPPPLNKVLEPCLPHIITIIKYINVVFTENRRCATQLEKSIVPFDFHLAVGADVFDVSGPGWTFGYVFLSDAHADRTAEVKHCDHNARSPTDK